MINSDLFAIDPTPSPAISSQPKPKGSQEQSECSRRPDQPLAAQCQPKGRQAPHPDASSSDKPLPPQKGIAQKQTSAKQPVGSAKPA
jgi:hypothetical protein